MSTWQLRIGEIDDANGTSALRAAEDWIDRPRFGIDRTFVEHFVTTTDPLLVHESFARDITFGTGGIRGPVGYGPNRINRYTSAAAAYAHAVHIADSHACSCGDGQHSVVLANDVRVYGNLRGLWQPLAGDPIIGMSSRQISFALAEIYADLGFAVHMVDPSTPVETLTTPELSFLIRHLGACGGVNVSASHNHPDDNGIKLYDLHGGQFCPPDDDALASRRIEYPGHEPHRAATELVSSGTIRAIPETAFAAYRSLYGTDLGIVAVPTGEVSTVCFTPLGGCGSRTVEAALLSRNYTVGVPPDQREDGTFAAIPMRAPNPEVAVALSPARDFASANDLDVVISTDPDADRLGVEVLHNGAWVHLDGNEIATIVAYFLLVDPSGPRKRGSVFSTLATTRAITAIARQAGCHVTDDLPIGFKFIAEAMRLRKDLGHDDFVFAAEESHGYLLTDDIRDKDACGAAVVIAALARSLRAEGQTLVDYLDAVYASIGGFADVGRSALFEGPGAMHVAVSVMRMLRENPPEEIGGAVCRHVGDRWDEDRFGTIRSASERESRNILELDFGDFSVVIRPSGTEPKVKWYVRSVVAGVLTKAQLATIANDVLGVVTARAGLLISAQARLLPDVIPVNSKAQFDTRVLEHLVADPDAYVGDRSEFLALLAEMRSVLREPNAMLVAAPSLAAALAGVRDTAFVDSALATFTDWAADAQ